jgi:HAD superfamily hydrolase (TIGR01484 family)
VKQLDPVPQAKFILSFDFDGTLHDPAGNPPVSRDFFGILKDLRESHGAIWGINTGRAIPHVMEGLVDNRFPFLPDWVVAREREIWMPNQFGRWIPHEPWNRNCAREHIEFFASVKGTLDAIRAEVEEHTGATWVEQPGDPAGLVARTEEEMAWIMSRVIQLTANDPFLGWQRNSVWLRFGHKKYQKGSALGEVARHFGLTAADCFAIGDSHNDFEMLSPQAAARLACPANAVPEVRAHINALEGYECQEAHSHGCVEALRHYFQVA